MHRTALAALALLIALAACSGSSPSPSEPESSSTSSPEATIPASAPVGCVNPPPDLATLIAATQNEDADPVACYGGIALNVEANWVGGGVADCPTAPEPAWLACSPFSLQAVGDTRKVGAPQLFVAVDPALSTLPESGTDVLVTGHFDDPAAETCHETNVLPDASPELVADTIERCRNIFVVSEVVPLEP